MLYGLSALGHFIIHLIHMDQLVIYNNSSFNHRKPFKENFKWYKSPNFVVRGLTMQLLLGYIFIYFLATDKGAMAFAIGILIFMIVLNFRVKNQYQFILQVVYSEI